MVRLNDNEVGSMGYGLMGFTWRPQPTPIADAIATMKTALNNGAVFWNGGTFYGTHEANSLHLLNAYFTMYPEDAEKVIISIKGPRRGDEQTIRNTIDDCLRILDGKKFLDIYMCARVDPNTPVEDTMRVLAQYIEEGKLGGICMDGSNAEAIRRASAVHKVSCIELEFNMFAQESTRNGVAETCAELDIPMVAYSPLAQSLLTDNPKGAATLAEGDVRKNLPRLQGQNFDKNVLVAREIGNVARRKGCSLAQIALAWIKYQSGTPGFAGIIPIPGATTPARVEENVADVSLTGAEFKELNDIIAKMPVSGAKY